MLRQLFQSQRLDVPNIAAVVGDGSVGREEAHIGDVDQCGFSPCGNIAVVFVRFVLRVDVAAEIRHQLIEIAVRLQDVVIAVRLFGGQCAAADLVDDAAQVVIAFDVAQRVVAVAAEFFHLFDSVAEDKAVHGPKTVLIP